MSAKINKILGEVCTKMCQIIYLKLLRMTIVQIAVHVISFCLILVSAIQAGLFFCKFDLDYFVQYGPVYFIILYMLGCSLTLPFFSNLAIYTLQEMDKWKHTPISPTVAEQNQRELNKTTIYLVLGICSGILTGICFLFPSDADKNVLYILLLFEDLFPDSEHVLTWIYNFALIPLILIAVVCPSHYLAFTITHFKSQVNTLRERIENIDIGYRERDILDQRSQDVIKQRLLFCIKFHINMGRSASETLRETQRFVFPFELLGILLMGSIVILVFTLEGTVLEQWTFRILSFTFSSFLTLAGLAHSGQTIENLVQSDKTNRPRADSSLTSVITKDTKINLTEILLREECAFVSFLSRRNPAESPIGVPLETTFSFLVTEQSDIYDSLIKVHWYKYNNSNRKLYLIFLISLRRTFKIKYSENISVNYDMGIQVAKSFFSAMSIGKNLQHQKHST